MRQKSIWEDWWRSCRAFGAFPLRITTHALPRSCAVEKFILSCAAGTGLRRGVPESPEANNIAVGEELQHRGGEMCLFRLVVMAHFFVLVLLSFSRVLCRLADCQVHLFDFLQSGEFNTREGAFPGSALVCWRTFDRQGFLPENGINAWKPCWQHCLIPTSKEPSSESHQGPV